VSINLLGAFKDIGHGYGQALLTDLASNPLLGLLIGILLTGIIQSSSTTTSIVVALVAGGVFGNEPQKALEMAIPIIMGANIGTCITNTLVSLGHIGSKIEFKRAFSSALVHDFFNILAVLALFPLQVYTNFLGKISWFLTEIFEGMGGTKIISPLALVIKPQVALVKFLFQMEGVITFWMYAFFICVMLYFLKVFVTRIIEKKSVLPVMVALSGILSVILVVAKKFYDSVFRPETAVFILGLCILFISLYSLVMILRGAVMAKMERLFHDYIFKTPLRAFLIGAILTAIVQSSSVTTSVAVPLAGAGIITIYQMFPYTLGTNIGTTITAILAALATGQAVAIAVAFAHLFFNISGIAIFYPLRFIPIRAAQAYAELSLRSKVIPILFIGLVFLVLPLFLIIILK